LRSFTVADHLSVPLPFPNPPLVRFTARCPLKRSTSDPRRKLDSGTVVDSWGEMESPG
jgi:hypothetical protein